MIFVQLFLAFAKIGFLSMGGMTMVPIINAEVLRLGWMQPDEVMDIVAIAEMTPGSLGINCATFVGLRTAGMLGAVCASLGVMAPSLTLCMLAARFLMRLKGNTILEDVMSGVRPVCLGMIYSVLISMSFSTLFSPDTSLILTAFSFLPETFSPKMLILIILSSIAMFRFRLSVLKTILFAACAGLLLGNF